MISAPFRFHRRRLLQTGLGALAGWHLNGLFSPGYAQPSRQAESEFRIEKIARTTARLPYREIPARNMARELPHWVYVEVTEVTLKSGRTGFGETLLYYGWGVTRDRDVQRAQGKNAVALMWDDSLGPGLQQALFDAVGRTAGVPVHALFGKQVHRQTPLSWWNIDTSPEDMAAECKEALRLGYLAYKTKGRPWFDVWKQVEVAAAGVPEKFKIDMDFNDTLLDAERATPILKALAEYPQVGIYESPIFQQDIPGNQALRKATRVPIAMHYGNPKPEIAIREDVCDGFVIGGGATRLLQQAHVAAMADKKFWLQLVGSGITAAHSLHYGGVCSHATWPAVNCHQLYAANTLTQPITLKDGMAAVPDAPGVGYELNRETLAKYQVDKPAQRPDPPRLIETSWPDGRKMYLSNNGRVNFMLNLARDAKMPFFERGVTTRLVPNDGTAEWKDLYERARKEAVMVKA